MCFCKFGERSGAVQLALWPHSKNSGVRMLSFKDYPKLYGILGLVQGVPLPSASWNLSRGKACIKIRKSKEGCLINNCMKDINQQYLVLYTASYHFGQFKQSSLSFMKTVWSWPDFVHYKAAEPCTVSRGTWLHDH